MRCIMPSGQMKNLLYKLALPVFAPSPEKDPVISVTGHPLDDRKSLARILRKHHVLGASVLLASHEDETLVLTRSLKTGQVPDENTMYRVASITKTATAMVTLRLCAEGLISLDSPVSLYLPDCCSDIDLKDVTLRHLLSHTSGLSDPADLVRLLEEGAPFRQAVAGRRVAEPGKSFRYSNLGFGLVGCVLESVTGKAVSEVFDEYLFRPLGMNATLEGCSLRKETIMPVVRVFPYHADRMLRLTELGKKPVGSPDPLRHYGYTAGSMYTDIRSLRKMIGCVMDGGRGLPGSETIRQMTCQHASYGAVSPALSYGLGLLIIQDPSISAGRVLGHQGFAYGCADGAFWDEESGWIMIILNGGCSEARDGRLGLCNRDMLRYAFGKEIPGWVISKQSEAYEIG